MNNGSNCLVCQKRLRGKQTMYCSSKCKSQIHQSYGSQKKRGVARKLALIDMLGGKCGKCGYNGNVAALSFHHKSSNKDFKLDARSLSNRTKEKILLEASKCELLCHNCHAEIHNPELDLAKLKS